MFLTTDYEQNYRIKLLKFLFNVYYNFVILLILIFN